MYQIDTSKGYSAPDLKPTRQENPEKGPKTMTTAQQP